MAYEACITLIRAGRTSGLLDKVEILYSRNKITNEQYTELVSVLNGITDQGS